MGKRRPVVVLSSSSSEEEGEALGGSATGGLESSRSRSRTAQPVSSKRPRVGSSKSRRVSSEASPELEVKFDLLSEDFCECRHEFRITPGFTCMDGIELWVDKHKPRSLPELAVHKKKVEEVKKWMEERVKTPKEGFGNCALLITGQAGVGKSVCFCLFFAAVHVIASQLEAELCEWMTPTPTLWQEHIHNTNSEIRYMSKLDEFENFVEKIRKYSLLHPMKIGGSRKPVIVLIDDIPAAAGRVAFARLNKCLTSLTQSTQVPTVILITEYHKTESGDNATHYWEELVSSLERAGAYKVAFNPITVNSIRKTLSKICQEEKSHVTAEWIDQIAKASGGDIRHAITSLQYCCLKPDRFFSLPASTLSNSYGEMNSDKSNLLSNSSLEDGNPDCKISLPCGRDETLTVFHALGKFLHNKRVAVDPCALVAAVEQDSFPLQERFARNPLKMDTPEKVLSQAHGQVQPIVDFLHENVLDFISDDEVDNVWLVTSYLSDADCLLGGVLRPTKRQMIPEVYEVESVAQSFAASVAIRGVLFANSKPSPSRWHTIRRPRLWQVEQSSRHNKTLMLLERGETYNNSSLCSMSYIAAECRPTIKWLRARTLLDVHKHENHLHYPEGEEDNSDWLLMDKLKGSNSEESEEDDIEDW
ncbi:cell cycle checkpoint protein RAD17 isoform X3 [Elaeis guineensis]|uniref:Cell cycle checkpoint protein RAD17 isoform X3 n=1 Tax=Elaeis guineensis var. tenera TaxID=51953 RepID=A0A6I9RVM8_ELAGV|nr:cell cycle checkpoint protein RAD17 isoform X3 [Elaeis guineensis]